MADKRTTTIKLFNGLSAKMVYIITPVTAIAAAAAKRQKAAFEIIFESGFLL